MNKTHHNLLYNMDTSSSSEELSSSDCDIESSCDDDSEKLETAKICGATLNLPQGLCESKEIFKEFFSQKTWNSLSEINKQHLKNFLPCFPENDDQEKNVTIQKLLNKERFRFNSPLMQFQEKLNAGHFRPDIAKMRSLVKHAQRKEHKYQQQQHYKNLLNDLVGSRQRLLDVSNSLPPGVEPRVEKHCTTSPAAVCPASYRAKRRYFQELATIKSLVGEGVDLSEDENYPEGPPVQLSKKQRRHLNGLQGNTNPSPGVERAVTSTLATKPTGLDLEYSITSTHNPYQLNEDAYRALLTKHKKRKLEYDLGPEMITKGISLRDIAQRTQLTPTKKSNGKPASVPNNEHKTTNKKKIKVEPGYRPVVNNVTTNYSPDTVKPHASSLLTSTLPSSNSEPEYSDSDSFIDPVMSPLPAVAKSKNPRARTPKPKQSSPRSSKGKTPPVNTSVTDFEPVKVKTEFEPIKIKTDPDMSVPCTSSLSLSTDNLVSPISQYGNRIVPATLSDLDGIDMMNLPVDLDDSNIDILEEINVKQELMQDTHANFLSLVRDIICSTMDHRMSMSSLEDRLKAWQENPISPLNDWYSLVDSWVSLLSSAVTFLTGESNEQPEDFVPYLEFKPMLHAYQWIGAGRDSDNLLSPLCQYWLEHRDDTALQNNTQDIEIDVVEKPQTPPPPRCPTQWSVRKAEPEEVEQFREQERQRYSNPHKAFTYRMNGYESVVGPVKGMYNQSAGVSKARGHSMLNADRPNFVTILTLVRDATARLPNGEGTRAEICELLKSSQYISQTAPENVLQSVVSGALDRMHTEFDPCVKYDTKRKIWIYLHRNRSEADFERIHQQCQGMSKQLKKATRKPKAKPNKEKPVKQNANKNATESQPAAAASATPAASVEKAPKAFKTPVCRVFTVPTVSATNTIVQTSAAATPSRQAAGTSLLVNSNVTAVKSVSSPKPTIQLQTVQDKVEPGSSMKTLLAAPMTTSSQANVNQTDRQVKIVTATIAPTKQDIEEAIQTLTPIRVASPITKQISSPKPGKSLVKIINSPQGKSLITSQAATGQQQQQTVFIKQVEQKTVNAKQLLTQPQITQQLLQSIAAQQQKQLKNTQQQIVQISQQKQATVTTQQLLKTVDQKPIQTIASPHLIQTITHQPQQTTTVTQANISQQLLQAITQQKQNQVTTLTSAQQQQQILQTLKQKVAQQNQQTVLTVQQAVLKQQANIHQLQKQLQQQQLAKGTSLLGQQRILAQVGTAKTAGSQNQTPLVAKVLTNAAGQVISVESLLAHQKQHGSLPQGTTLRVSGAKPGQTNLIQLSGTSPNQVAQFAVVSQNNIVSIAGQQRLISTVTSQPPTTTSTVTVVTTAKALTKNHTKPQTPTKFVSSKLTHQLVNAKFIQNVGNNKLVQQQKIVVNQQNQIKINAAMKPVAVTKTVSSSNQTGNTVRMVNAAGLNLAHIAGKPVLLASKGNTIQNIQGQNVILQAQPSISTSSGSIVLPNNARVIQGGSMVTQQSQSVQQSQGNAQVVLGTQLKVQNVGQNVVQTNTPHVVLGHNLKPQSTVSLATQQSTQNQTVVLGGHTIKMQTGTQSNQRVVLASQGQGGQLVAQQILLPPGFQGGAINIKTLQGLKVIPLAQTQQTKGRPQQVFARIMNPGSASRITQVTSTQSTSQIDGGGNQGNKE